MDPARVSHGHLRAADGPREDAAFRLAVDPQRPGERGPEVCRADVIDVAAHRVALEVNQVQPAARVQLRLGIQPAVGNAERLHARPRRHVRGAQSAGRAGERETQASRRHQAAEAGQFAPTDVLVSHNRRCLPNAIITAAAPARPGLSNT